MVRLAGKANRSCLAMCLLLTFQNLLPVSCTMKSPVFADNSILALYLWPIILSTAPHWLLVFLSLKISYTNWSHSLSKSCSLDPILFSLLKSCSDTFTSAITWIITHSLLTGSVPQCFKQALTAPLLKKPGPDNNAQRNYRPVSNLPFLPKLLEKVVLHQLVEHITNYDLLELKQSAYHQHYSTETAFLHVTNFFLCNMD